MTWTSSDREEKIMDEFMFRALNLIFDHGVWVLGLMAIVAVIVLWWSSREISYNKLTAGIKDTSVNTRTEFNTNYGDIENDPWKHVPKNRKGDK